MIFTFSFFSSLHTRFELMMDTMQVASQQGEYLAKCFNRLEECEERPEGPLRFRGTGRHRFRPFRSNLKIEVLALSIKIMLL